MNNVETDTLYYNRGCSKILVKEMKFPAGEVGVNINPSPVSYAEEWITLTAKALSSDKLMAMFLATDAIRRNHPNAKIELYIPYLPYARQDRVCNNGEALSVKVMCHLINSMGYDSVVIVDPHSTVTPALLNKCRVIEQEDVFSSIKTSYMNTYIVSPDMGASKKAESFCKRVGAKGVIYVNKSRDLQTGKITGMSLLNENIVLKEADELLVLDDICDGGYTFVELARLLLPYKPALLELATTHGIFSKGLKTLTDLYDKVYTSNSLPQVEDDNLIVVNIKN